MAISSKTCGHTSGYGFTLIELILATAISAIVIGILAACLTFALRAWESTQNRRPDHTAALVDLLKQQLAEIDLTPIKFEDGQRPVFTGQHGSIVFATAHSIKAISQGVPVVARYSYDQRSKLLLYAEVPLDPYHPKLIQTFLKAGPSNSEKENTRFYGIDIPGFALRYAGKDSQQFSEVWDKPDEIPVEIMLTWSGKDFSGSQVFMVNCPFPIALRKANTPDDQAGLVPLPAGGIAQ